MWNFASVTQSLTRFLGWAWRQGYRRIIHTCVVCAKLSWQTYTWGHEYIAINNVMWRSALRLRPYHIWNTNANKWKSGWIHYQAFPYMHYAGPPPGLPGFSSPISVREKWHKTGCLGFFITWMTSGGREEGTNFKCSTVVEDSRHSHDQNYSYHWQEAHLQT